MARANTAPILHRHNPLLTSTPTPSHSLFLFKHHYSNSLSSSSFSFTNNDQSHLRYSQSHGSINHVTRVSTAPVEYAPPAPEFNFRKEIARLKTIIENLGRCKTLEERLKIISSDARVKSYFNTRRKEFDSVISSLSDGDVYLLKCVVAAGQGHVLSELEGERGEGERSSIRSAIYALAEMIESWDGNGGVNGEESKRLRDEERNALRSLIRMLGEVEKFYDCIGGIIG